MGPLTDAMQLALKVANEWRSEGSVEDADHLEQMVEVLRSLDVPSP